jgi:hypothetical protein
MKDGLYDFRTWPQAGRDQLERCLLQGKEKYLERCLAGETDYQFPKEDRQKIADTLTAVRQKLASLTP